MKKENQQSESLKQYLEGSLEFLTIFRWVFTKVLTKESKKWIVKMLIASSLMILIQGFQPGAISYIFNGLSDKKSRLVFEGLAMFAVCLFLQKIIQRYHDRCREWVLGLNWRQLDDKVTELFFEKSLSQHVSEGHALATSNIEKGKTRLQEIERALLFEGIPVFLQLMVSWIFLFFLNIVAGFIMTVVMIIYVLWSLYLNSLVSRVYTPIDKKWKRLHRRRTERFDNVEKVKVCDKEVIEINEMSETFSNILADDRRFWLSFLDKTFLRSLLNGLGLATIMSWGAYLVWSGKLNLGLLYPLYSWSSRVSENIWQLGSIEHQINWNMPAVKSMIEALALVPKVKDPENPIELDPSISHTIELVDVSHSYPKERKISNEEAEALPAISRVSFKIRIGEKVALLGASGAGKSTIMKKLLRFDDPTRGRILIDNIDLRALSQSSWKKGIGYIPQNAQVLDGTIKYNITYGLNDEEKAKVSDQQIWNLMRLLQIDFGDRLTEGLQTIVGKRGMKLSGGQAQRLMIGAAVIKKPWLLVVDEATSSLDSTTEKQVQEGLKVVLSQGQTSALIVAHRLSTVRYLCDTFVVLKSISEVKNGDSQVEAIESSFENLYQVSPTFRQLADDQGMVLKAN